MPRYINRPPWLNDGFDHCASSVIKEIDDEFSSIMKPRNALLEDCDPEIEPSLAERLSMATQHELHVLHKHELWCFSKEGFIYFLPSLARLSLIVADFDDPNPAEDTGIDFALIIKCQEYFDAMTEKQQAICKCLVALLLCKEIDPALCKPEEPQLFREEWDQFQCNINTWKSMSADILWSNMLWSNLKRRFS